MKRWVLILVLMTPPAGAGAQNYLPAPFEVSVLGGFDLPTGALNDLYDSGYNVGGQAAFRITPNLGVGVSGVYHAFSTEVEVDSVAFDVKATVWEITTFLQYRFIPGSGMTPYLKFAVGAFSNSATADEGSFRVPLVDGTEFGLGAGAGIRGSLNPTWGLFLEGMYLLDLTEGEDVKLISVRGGVTLHIRSGPNRRSQSG